jgi:uncharacterized protein YqeY
MSLLDTLTADMKAAMKARDKDRLQTIRMLISGVKNVLIDKPTFSEADEVDYLSTEAKKRRQSIEAYEQADREDLAAVERAELLVIEHYLPQQLSEDEVRTIVQDAIASTGAASASDLGKVMGAIMPQIKGRFDGAKVRPIVQDLLG